MCIFPENYYKYFVLCTVYIAHLLKCYGSGELAANPVALNARVCERREGRLC
jgi:hypothetical protein